MPKQAAKAKAKAKKAKPTTKQPAMVHEPAAVPMPVPNVLRLTEMAAKTIWQQWRLFGGIVLIYGLLNIVLVRGLAGGTSVADIKQQLDSGNLGSIASGLSVFVVLVGSSGNSSSSTAGAYQFFLGLVFSLAIIWALRHVMTGSIVRARDAYYKGMYPLIPFMLVLIVIGLQLIPLLIGSALYSTVIANGIATQLFEKLLFLAVFILLAGVSFYLLSSSLFALYIVTLPDMAPLKALRSARDLVRHRRAMLLRKIIWLPFMLLIIALIIMLPIIAIAAPVAQWIFFLLSIFGLLAIHAYMYTLYRGLLRE